MSSIHWFLVSGLLPSYLSIHSLLDVRIHFQFYRRSSCSVFLRRELRPWRNSQPQLNRFTKLLQRPGWACFEKKPKMEAEDQRCGNSQGAKLSQKVSLSVFVYYFDISSLACQFMHGETFSYDQQYSERILFHLSNENYGFTDFLLLDLILRFFSHDCILSFICSSLNTHPCNVRKLF